MHPLDHAIPLHSKSNNAFKNLSKIVARIWVKVKRSNQFDSGELIFTRNCRHFHSIKITFIYTLLVYFLFIVQYIILIDSIMLILFHLVLPRKKSFDIFHKYKSTSNMIITLPFVLLSSSFIFILDDFYYTYISLYLLWNWY